MPADHAQSPRQSAGETAYLSPPRGVRYARPAPKGANRTDAAGVAAQGMGVASVPCSKPPFVRATLHSA